MPTWQICPTSEQQLPRSWTAQAPALNGPMRWLVLLVLLVGLVLVVVALRQGADARPSESQPTTSSPSGETGRAIAAPSASGTSQGAAEDLDLASWTPTSTRGSLKVLEKKWFRIGYDEGRKNPAWVSYSVSGSITFPGREPTRPSTFQTDFASHVSHHDYSRSGFDRGHLCPAYAMWSRFGAEAFNATFVCSNIIPQPHAVNAGIWEDLEVEISGRFGRSGGWAERGPLLVLNGPIYSDRPDRFPAGVTIPSFCFSVIFRRGEQGVECLAFEIPNEGRPGGPLSRYLVSVERIERDAGLDFFGPAHEGLRRRLGSAQADRLWN